LSRLRLVVEVGMDRYKEQGGFASSISDRADARVFKITLPLWSEPLFLRVRETRAVGWIYSYFPALIGSRTGRAHTRNGCDDQPDS
jgi:hypothetical protein